MLSVDVATTTLDQLIADMIEMRSKLEDRKKPLYAIKKYQLRRWAKNFDQEGKIYGAWRPLRLYTQIDRAFQGYAPAHPILQREGTLLSWVTQKNKEGKFAADAITWEFHANGAKDGSYAVFHDTGYFNRPFNTYVPPRVIWDVNAEDEDANEKRMANYVDSVLAQYFS